MATEILLPDAILAANNLTGAVTDIDEGVDSPDGLWLVGGDDGTDTDVRVSFPTPSGDLNTGAGLQTFRAYLRKFVTGGGTPQIEFQLWESGVFVSSLIGGTFIDVTSETGQTITATWDAASLAAVSGANVELLLIGHQSGGSPASRRSIEVGAVDWITDHAAAAGPTGDLAATESGSDTASITGDVIISGDLSATDAGPDTAAVSGSLLISGTLAVSEIGSDTVAITGSLLGAISGDLAVTEVGADVGAFSGVLKISGALAASEPGPDTTSVLGSLDIAGTLSATEVGPDTAAAAATLLIQGDLASTETGADVAAITGTALTPITGDLNVTEAGADTASLDGEIDIAGTLAVIDAGPDTAAVAGKLPITSDFTIVESGQDTAALTGTLVIVGSMAASEAGQDIAIILGTDNPPIFGNAPIVETGADTLSAVGILDITGDLNAIEIGTDTAAISGPPAITPPVVTNNKREARHMDIELDILNAMLAAIGTTGITSKIGRHPGLIKSQPILNRENRSLQARGHWFNTDYSLQIAPSADGEYILPQNVLKADMTNQRERYVRRGYRLYDPHNNTYNINSGNLEVKVTVFLDWGDLPESYIDLVRDISIYKIVSNSDADQISIRTAQQDVIESKKAFHAEKLAGADHSLSSNPEYLRILWGNRAGGGTLVPTYLGGIANG